MIDAKELCFCHINRFKVKDSTARTAAQEAKDAAQEAKTAADNALPLKGGIMAGNIQMKRNSVIGANALEGENLEALRLALKYEQSDYFPETLFKAEPVSSSVIHFSGIPKENGEWNEAAAQNVVLRGIAAPVGDYDAVNKEYFESQIVSRIDAYMREALEGDY